MDSTTNMSVPSLSKFERLDDTIEAKNIYIRAPNVSSFARLEVRIEDETFDALDPVFINSNTVLELIIFHNDFDPFNIDSPNAESNTLLWWTIASGIDVIHIYELSTILDKYPNIVWKERETTSWTKAGNDVAFTKRSTTACPATPTAPAALPISWNGKSNVDIIAEANPETALTGIENTLAIIDTTWLPIVLATTEAAASISFPWRADIRALPKAEAEKKRSASPKTDKTVSKKKKYEIRLRHVDDVNWYTILHHTIF